MALRQFQFHSEVIDLIRGAQINFPFEACQCDNVYFMS